MIASIDKLFEPRVLLPNPESDLRLSRLVGLDDTIERISKIMGVLINPYGLKKWIDTHHADASSEILNLIQNRHNLILFSGDVGTGKTELAETIGSKVARSEHIELTLYKLSLASRGSGRVGEMTELISSAFDTVIRETQDIAFHEGRYSGGSILFIDEADALAQSRELDQMHHEDRAGVNALIRGIDRVNQKKLPITTLMCTNRDNSLDPAVKRRAAEIVYFTRPNEQQRKALFENLLTPFNFSSKDIQQIVDLTGSNGICNYGYSYSDIRQRLIPNMILGAYPASKVNIAIALSVISSTPPTPVFKN